MQVGGLQLLLIIIIIIVGQFDCGKEMNDLLIN